MRVGQKRPAPAVRNRLLMGLLLLGPVIALAAPPPIADSGGAARCNMGFRGPPPHPQGPPGGPGPGGGFEGGEGSRPPPFMMGVSLTEDQQDKIFSILHAAAPALHTQEKAVHKAREALHDLVRSSSFSEGSAASLAQAQGSAESQLALLRTRMEHDVYAVLTPEQQSKIAAREKECDFHGRGGPPGGGPLSR